MKKRVIKPDKNLILWNGKYYVINDFTYKLLDMFDKKLSMKQIKKITGLSAFKIKRLYKKIEKKLLSKDYYEDNFELETPIKIQWKITNKCNLKCKHCYLGKLDNEEQSYENAMSIVDSIISSNVMEVTLSGGECLTYDRIEEVVQKLLLNGINVYIFTNGLLLDKFINKIAQNIKDKTSILFYVSVDGLKESHEAIRGKNTFDKVINNIKLAVSQGYIVVTNTVINSINYDDIINMIILLKKIGVKDIQLSNLIMQGSATDDLKISLKMQMSLKDKLKKLYSHHSEYGYIYYSEVPDDDHLRKIYKISKNKEKYIGNNNWKCTAGMVRATIDVKGRIYCCPFLKDSYIGDLTIEKLPKVWNNKGRYEFLAKLAKNNQNGVCLAIKNSIKEEKKND